MRMIDSNGACRYHNGSPQTVIMSESRQPIDARNATQDPSTVDDTLTVSSERVLEVLSQIARGDLSGLANGKQLAPPGKDLNLLLNLDSLVRRLRYIVGRLQRAADSI